MWARKVKKPGEKCSANASYAVHKEMDYMQEGPKTVRELRAQVQEKDGLVGLADAVAQPQAVMVECGDTLPAGLAMLRPQGLWDDIPGILG